MQSMKKQIAKELLKKVNLDYSAIAEEFSHTRHYLWPEFKFFKKYVKKGQTVIDVGCGNGRLIHLFEDQKNIRYIGIEKNKKLVSLARKNFPGEYFLQGDILKLPLEDKSADIVFCIAVLHHIPSPFQSQALHELYRILKPKGYLILTVWNLFQKKYTQGNHTYGPQDTFIPWGKSGVKRYYYAFLPQKLKGKLKKGHFKIKDFFYTAEGEKTYWLNSHNIVAICQK